MLSFFEKKTSDAWLRGYTIDFFPLKIMSFISRLKNNHNSDQSSPRKQDVSERSVFRRVTPKIHFSNFFPSSCIPAADENCLKRKKLKDKYMQADRIDERIWHMPVSDVSGRRTIKEREQKWLSPDDSRDMSSRQRRGREGVLTLRTTSVLSLESGSSSGVGGRGRFGAWLASSPPPLRLLIAIATASRGL